MSGFKLSSQALRDVAEILSYYHRELSPARATSIENQLFAAFLKLTLFPELGHRRADITDKDILFQMSQPYAIIFRRTPQRTQIVRVIHASRDLKKLLR